MGRVLEPDADRRQVDGALVHELALVITCRDRTEWFELAKAVFDGVAVFALCGVEGGQAAAVAAAVASVLLLAFLGRNDGFDAALAQVSAVGSGGVRLVAQRGGPGGGLPLRQITPRAPSPVRKKIPSITVR